MSNFEFFDIVSYLENKQIDVHYPGEKNVSRGWVNINCPFCDGDDPSWHLGISMKSRFINCYICGQKGPVTKLVRILEGNCSAEQIDLIIEKYQDYSVPVKTKETEKKIIHHRNILPKEATDEFPTLHLNYLRSRNFDPEYLIKKYGLKACYNFGDYRFCIVIPIFLNGKIVNFSSRDVTNKAVESYRHCPNDEAIINMKNCLYNIDTVQERVIIEEGFTDVWRTGDGSIATMGIQFTLAQLGLLLDKNVKAAFVLFDSEEKAIKRANDLANDLSGFINHVEVITLSGGDPADLSEEVVRDLRKDIFGVK